MSTAIAQSCVAPAAAWLPGENAMKKKTRPFGVVDGGVSDEFDGDARQDLIVRLILSSVLTEDPEKKKRTWEQARQLRAAWTPRLSRADLKTLH